ncbi:peptide ABC transporter permease [Propionigenium maris DSM 9537]|uniref:Peptide ABC transporter permease n=1 Tax=Propionigenium maris DSM 9537 TaxID=1123000 RepID=A0A9W6GPG8_9FUSO|nr:ShlB/FhaC/HecB family hemolysin secretion/activation protein [Propionigenium maris]GLI57402.1 peptide ABC transporter permease [Propionigenium maris DSM 9537]
MRRGRSLIYITLLIVIISQAVAAKEVRSSAERTQELEMRRLKDERVQQELKGELKKLETQKEEEEKLEITSDQKFYISKITLINAELISTKEKRAIISKYVNREIGLKEIDELIREITNLYIKKGYVSARVSIPTDQNLKSQELKLKIFEGKVEEIKINDGGRKDNLKKKYNLQLKEGDVVDLRKIEHSESIINGVPKSKGVYKLVPGEKYGQTILEGETEGSKIGNFDLTYDNLGQEGTGRNNVRAGYSHGDIIGISDVLYIQGSTTLKDEREQYNRSVFVDYKIPLKLWETGLAYSYSRSKEHIDGDVSTILQESEVESIKLKLNRSLYNGARGKLKMVSAFTVKESDSYIQKSWVETTSYKSSQYDIGVSYTGIISGGSAYGKVNYVRGLGSLGADKDPDNSEARRQFDKIKLYGRYYKPLKWLENSLAYETTLEGQYSLDDLYSSDKFYIGDDLTVRGFQNGVSGENGMFVRQQLYYSINSGGMAGKLKVIQGAQLFIGADYGFADNSINKESSQYLSREEVFSVSVGIKKNFARGSLSTTYSVPIKAPDYVEKDEGGIFYILASIYL